MADEEGYIDVSFDQNGGVMKKILKEAPEGASGPPPNGNEVEAHYTGKQHDVTHHAHALPALTHNHNHSLTHNYRYLGQRWIQI